MLVTYQNYMKMHGPKNIKNSARLYGVFTFQVMAIFISIA